MIQTDTCCNYCDRPLLRECKRPLPRYRKVSGCCTQCLQLKLLQNKPPNHQNPCCNAQHEGLRRSPYNEEKSRNVRNPELYSQQHGKVHLLFLGNLRFIDSYGFLLSSLDNLVSSNKPEVFEITKQAFPDLDTERLALLLKKGRLPVRVHELEDSSTERGFLQQAEEGRHYGRRVRTCEEGVARVRLQKSRGVS